jgi:hypothetical protein
MKTNEHEYMVGLYKGQVVTAMALAALSFGAFSKAEKERALAERLGNHDPAFEQVMGRVALPEGAGKMFGWGALVVGSMGIAGLFRARRSK